MPVSGNYGTPNNPIGDMYASFWELQWYTGSDPAHVEGDLWGRSDLLELRFDHGSGVWQIPVFPVGASGNGVEEVLRVGGDLETSVSREADDDTLNMTGGGRYGIVIETHGEITETTATISDNTSGVTTAYLHEPDGTEIESTSISGGEATFTTTLNANTEYRIVADAGGPEYPAGYDNDPSFPYTGNHVDIISGSFSDSDDDDAFNFVTVETTVEGGFVPVIEGTAGAFAQLGFHHSGARYGVHDALGVIPTSGLQHDWPLDAGSGSTVTDEQGNNDGTINGATWTTTAKTGGQALSFDPTNSEHVGGIDSLTQFDAASIVAWIRPAAIDSGPYSAVMRGGENDVDFGFSLVDNSGDGDYDDIRFAWRDGDNNFNDAFADGQAAANTWIMIAHTVDSTNGFDGYVNGGTNVASASSQTLDYNGNTLNFGRRTIDDQYFDGVIDGNILYYNRKLTASDVSSIHNATV